MSGGRPPGHCTAASPTGHPAEVEGRGRRDVAGLSAVATLTHDQEAVA